MYRIAKQDFYSITQDQLCRARPLLLLQQPLLQLNITLPDQIRFHYPDAEGRLQVISVTVDVVGENAHGVCFLSGVRVVSGGQPVLAGSQAAMVQSESFRMNLIRGAIIRICNSERLSLASWERRVRRRFATAWKTDALPLSTMLIGVKKNGTDLPD